MNRNAIIIIFCLIFLVSCSPSEAQIQYALEQTQQAQPSPTFPPENPKPTDTPAYCPPDTSNESLDTLLLTYVEYSQEHERGVEDYHVHKEVVIEITKMKNGLDKSQVPPCLEDAKKLLSTCMQNSIDAFKEYMSGSQVGYQEHMVELSINSELFFDEHDRITQCLPNCTP